MSFDSARRYTCMLLCLSGAILLSTAPANAQFSWDRPRENLKVLPDTISAGELRATMRGFANGLGVRCSFCHDDSKGHSLDEIDFASDAKPEKDVARLMMKMVSDINKNYIAKVSHGDEKDEPSLPVKCITCHRGVTHPRMLQDVLASTIESNGVDSARSKYQVLREKYYGRMAYDFGAESLNELGYRLLRQDEKEAALEIFQLNVQMNAGDSEANQGLGDAYIAVGDTVHAVQYYKTALEQDPHDRRLAHKLEELQ